MNRVTGFFQCLEVVGSLENLVLIDSDLRINEKARQAVLKETACSTHVTMNQHT